jgi:hypothetical protein
MILDFRFLICDLRAGLAAALAQSTPIIKNQKSKIANSAVS